MSERLPFVTLAGLAMPEVRPLETGYAELPSSDEHLAEVIQLPRRRLFGFGRALVEAPAERRHGTEPRYRTAVTFRRLWPGEGEAPAAAEAPAAQPTWRTACRFSRDAAAPTVVAIGTVELRELPYETPELLAAAADERTEATQILNQSEPSNIDPEQAAAAVAPDSHPQAAAEPEVVVQPEIVVPAQATEPAPVAADAADEQQEKTSRFKGRAPRPKRSGRGGGQSRGRRLVGLKVGSSQLAAAVVANDGRPELTQLARTPFETGIVVDGEVRDEDALAAALKDFFAQANLPTRDVRVGLASNRIGVRTLEMTDVDDEHFDNAVRFKAHEVLPIAMDESVLDYRVLSEHVGDDGKKSRRVLLVVAPRDQVDPYLSACRKAGIRLQGIDLEAFALLRAFVEPRTTDAAEQAAIVVASIGHESTTLVVSGAGVCEFTRVFGWGGAQLDAAISSACGINQVEAAALKTQLSLTGTLPEGADPALAGKALEAVRTELTLFARELVSSLQFYQKQPDSLGIGEVVVTGGTSQLGGLADSLHTLVGVPIRLGDPLARVVAGRGVVSDPTLTETIGSLSVAIGLGIDDDAMRAVNLLPADAQVSMRKRPGLTQVLVPAGLAVPVVALAAMFLPAHSQVGDRQSELEGLKAELATLPQPQAPGIDQGIKGEQARRAAVVADVLSRRTAWDRVMHQLSLVVPTDVWLTQVRGSAPQPLSAAPIAETASNTTAKPAAPTVAVTPTGLTLTGRTYGQDAVAKLLARLSTVPTLTNVQLTRSTRTKVDTRKVIEFEIAADLRGAGETS